MMPKLKTIQVFAILPFLCASAFGGEDWSYVLPWVDKYPSDKLGPRSSGLLDQPEIRGILSKLLPKAESAELAKYDTEAPVTKFGNYVIINKCLPHNCPAAMAMLVIDVTGKKLWVGLFSRKDQGASTRWYGNADDYSKLPDEIKKEFLSRHGD
jgi:hypothetical protein